MLTFAISRQIVKASSIGGAPESMSLDWEVTGNRASSHLIRRLLCLVYGSKTLALASNITSMIGMVSTTSVGVWPDIQEDLLGIGRWLRSLPKGNRLSVGILGQGSHRA